MTSTRKLVVILVVVVAFVASSAPVAAVEPESQDDWDEYPEFPELNAPEPGSAEDPAEVYDESRAGGPPPSIPMEIPAGDFSDRPGTGDPEPVDLSQAEPVTDEWSETTQVYDNGNSTRTAVIATEPVEVKDGSGEWVDIDTDLVVTEDGFSPKGAAIDLIVPTDPADGLVSIGTPAGEVTVSAPGLGGRGEPVVVDGVVSSETGDSSVTSLVQATASGFEHLLVLEDASGPSSYTLEFALPVGVKAFQVGPGVEFTDAEGGFVGWFGGSLAWDSARTDDTPSAETSVNTKLAVSSEGSATVEVSIDPAWLADPARKFPVTIDPSWSGNSGSSGADTYVKDGLTSSQWSAGQLNLGYDAYASKVARALIKFDVPENANYGVVSADLDVRNTFAWSCTKRPVDSKSPAPTSCRVA